MSITIVGLGPAGIDLLNPLQLATLTDESSTVIVRTLRHPSAASLAEMREVVTCDDLYDSLGDFDAVYDAIVERVLGASETTNVVYAVPGSAIVGERSAAAIRERATERGVPLSIDPGMSFLDLVFAAVGVDPLYDGVQVLNAHDMPDPLPLHIPTVISQVESPLRAAETASALGRILDSDFPIVVLDRLGDADEVVLESTVGELATYPASERTTVYVPAAAVGLYGLVTINRILREECPWDRKQTHHTLLSHLIEEAYETADAIGRLENDAPGGSPDFGVYAEVEEELGDLLLQVVFHATLASEAGAFDIDEVAEAIRRKLVARHPHVFADVEVADADEVLANWEEIKKVEKGRESLMDDIPSSMASIPKAIKTQQRAAGVGFDWTDADTVLKVLISEIEEFQRAATDDERVHELGDILFSALNVARHAKIDPDMALRASVERFTRRFRAVETSLAGQGIEVADASDAQLASAWSEAKR